MPRKKSSRVRRSYLHCACKNAPTAAENKELVRQLESGINPALNAANEREAMRLARKLLGLPSLEETERPRALAADTPKA